MKTTSTKVLVGSGTVLVALAVVVMSQGYITISRPNSKAALSVSFAPKLASTYILLNGTQVSYNGSVITSPQTIGDASVATYIQQAGLKKYVTSARVKCLGRATYGLPVGDCVLDTNQALIWVPNQLAGAIGSLVPGNAQAIFEVRQNFSGYSITMNITSVPIVLTNKLPAPTLPDLSPVSIAYSPTSNIHDGDNVTLYSGVTNSGGVATVAFNYKWFLDGAQIGYGSYNGISASSTIKTQDRWIAKTGTHTLQLVLDADNHVVESNENNNSTSVTINVQ